MGYSLTGIVDEVGNEVSDYKVGDRVMCVAPHAEYIIAEPNPTDGRTVHLPTDVDFEEGTFLPLATSAVAWSDSSDVKSEDTVVILGQGLVGSLMMQVIRGYSPERIITVDGLSLRCELSLQLGADVSINAEEEDPVPAVRRLTNERGANLVIDCVGGYAGVKSFEQAQDMVRQFGTIQLIALYQQKPLPLHASKMMNKRLVAGILTDEPRANIATRALHKIQKGAIRASDMVTHRFHYTEAKAAFDLLWNSPGDTLGVLLKW